MRGAQVDFGAGKPITGVTLAMDLIHFFYHDVELDLARPFAHFVLYESDLASDSLVPAPMWGHSRVVARMVDAWGTLRYLFLFRTRLVRE